MRRPVRRPARRPMAGSGPGIGSLGFKAKPGTKKPSSFAAGKIKPAVKKAVRPGMTKKPSRPTGPRPIRPPRRVGRRR